MTARFSSSDQVPHAMISALGRWSVMRLSLAVQIIEMLMRIPRDAVTALRHGRGPIRTVLMRQIYFTGLEACGIIVAVAALLGIVIISQVVSLAGNNGALTAKILVWVVLRELAPLLTAIIVIARSGTAIATELGSMKINNEIESLEMMGIPADRYLILPRILGVTASIVTLTVYFVMATLIAGFAVASIGWHIPLDPFLQGVLSAVGGREIAALFGKSILFGLFISSTCCCYGLRVSHSVTEIPQAATRSVMTCLFLVFMLDGLVTYLFLLTFS